MLVLTRKLMEKLYIGDDVCVTVVRLEGGQVRLGIEAPREISVVRAELLDKPGSATREHGRQPGVLPAPMSLRTRLGAAHGSGTPRRGPSQ